MLYFKDNKDGYYQFNDDAHPSTYAHLIQIDWDEAKTFIFKMSPAEVESEKDANAIELNEPKKAFAAVLEILWDNSAELRAAFSTKAALKQAAVAAYRAKL